MIFQSKPNPMGKDKTSSGIPRPEQLLGEWVDIKNSSNQAIRFATIKLYHTLFNNQCQAIGQPEVYWNGNGTDLLNPGQVLRIYTGSSKNQALMANEDQGALDWRGFAERSNFVLNNRCGDTLIVTWQDQQGRQYQDKASYAANPPEGAILKRSANMLVPAWATGRY